MAFTLTDSLSFTGTGNNSSVHLNTVTNYSASIVTIAANGPITSVTDSKGNSYTTTVNTNVSGNYTYEFHSFYAVLDNTTTVTVTPTSGLTVWSATWQLFTGGLNTVDKSSTSSGTGTAITSGATATTTTATELVLGFGFQANNRPWTVGGGYTSIQQAANGSTASVFSEYANVTSTGAQTATATIDISSTWIFAVATYSSIALTLPTLTLSGTTSGSAVNSLTSSVTVMAGSTVLAAITCYDSTSGTNTVISGVTYGGVALTKLNEYDNNGNASNALYALQNVSGGTANLVVTFAGTCSNPAMEYAVYAGTATSGGVDAHTAVQNASANSSTGATLSITTVAANAAVYGWAGFVNNSGGVVGGSNQQQLDQFAGNYAVAGRLKGLQATPGSVSMAYKNGTTDSVDIFLVSLAPVASGSILTKTQTATGRISVSLTKTQTAVGRIAKSFTKTQTATGRIAKSLTKTQTAIAHITANVTKTQTATGRITATVTKTQTAVGRVALSRSASQTAVARIAKSFTKTQSATARITVTATKTQPATGRITATLTKTQPAIGRITLSRTLTQLATSRLSVSRTLTQTATGRVTEARTASQTAVSRIAKSFTKTQTATGRISAIVTKTQTATANISVAASSTKTQTATGRIVATVTKTQTAVGRIAKSFTRTQTAIGRITLSRTLSQTATGRITKNLTLTQTATGRITESRSLSQTAVSRIAKPFTKTQTATARITEARTTSQTATARVIATRSLTQTATGRISGNNQVTFTQTATGRIVTSLTYTQLATGRIVYSRSLTQTATGRINVFTPGKAVLWYNNDIKNPTAYTTVVGNRTQWINDIQKNATFYTVSTRSTSNWGHTTAIQTFYFDERFTFDDPLTQFDYLINRNTDNQRGQTKWTDNT